MDRFALCLLAGFMAFGWGCQDSLLTALENDGFTYELHTNDTNYWVGEDVRITFAVINNCSEEARTHFSTEEWFGFEIRLNSLTVRREPRDPTEASTRLDLGPGERIEFREVWDQRDDEGNLVEPGVYEVVGHLMRNDAPRVSTLIVIQVD